MAAHVPPVLVQLMPAGLELTVPDPEPDTVTVRGCCLRVNVAVTAVAAVMVTLHAPLLEHPPPDQLVKSLDDAGDAISCTVVPWLNVPVQLPFAGQVSPLGVDETDPLPVPVRLTVSVYCRSVKVAVTLCAWSMVTMQDVVPLHAPPHPVKSLPVEGDRKSVV